MTYQQTVSKLVLAGWGMFLALPAFAADQTVRIDFGASQNRSVAPWNNVDKPTSVGLVVTDCQDADGLVTSVAIRQTNPWAGYNLAGTKLLADWPSAASQDSLFVETGIDDQAEFQLEGLKPEASYQVTIFASRMGGSARRIGEYELAGASGTLDAHDNQAERLVFDRVLADADGKVKIRVRCAPQSKYAYLGALEIVGEFPPADSQRQPADDLKGPPLVQAQAWAIADGSTGEILWSKNSSQVRAMASTTKMMTALLVMELCQAAPQRWNDRLVVSERADKTPGSTASLKAGETILAKEALYGLLLPSGNDAAVVLAEHFGRYLPADADRPVAIGTARDTEVTRDEALRRFVVAMNRRAAALSMKETIYLDPHGNSANRSSARDLVRLGWEAFQNEDFRRYVNTRNFRGELTSEDSKTRMQTWKNTNQLLGIEGFDGIKTGMTGAAGACLVSTGVRDGDRLLVVILGSTRDNRYLDSRNLYRWAWSRRQAAAAP
ncbi:D-alanyl-D-alanine carboxypeptidase family protein [Blastopirellula retiformator]|uniref:D-alanyl-D-alanine carboxypeptidase DacB n=1 Tax=Blastopirellula retiformator TaxID=2527970 RepID=A0A5C5V2E1_9BACT|nr:serine hydrolase [Blastopirellula retiformator]TWT31892.1 D-alanyl-D-alanine carboxypeptidase DacB precursor [Blastopirellula retiformator]